MADTGQTSAGHRVQYGAPAAGGYHSAIGPTAVSYNGIAADQPGPGAYRQPGPPPPPELLQSTQYYPGPVTQRLPHPGVYGPHKSSGMRPPGWMRYGGPPQTPTLVQGPAPDGWMSPEYAQTSRSMVDAGGANQQPIWHQQQQQHLTSPPGLSPYANRLPLPPMHDTQVGQVRL